MNNRIEELSRIAYQYAESNSQDGDNRHGQLYRDKFAELIIDDCAMLVDTHDRSDRYGSEYREITGNDIKTRFGA